MRSPYSLYPVHPVWSQPRYQHRAPYRYPDPSLPLTIRIEISVQVKAETKPVPSAKHPYKGQFIDVTS
ncbi:hypothetical protein [Ammoniphilus sp. YIM 78166]|uniref:hypothetical protein n=1 Tax=Ammoniphilus sp. YIM 78166 TaxID=1644106 RepID=UPI00106FD775|nr:hypothetical protein [Ammoniphilus sp. YIM 78166]